jgi:hypothetical protein
MATSNWVRPVVLGASCLVLGFVGGWTAASIGDDTVALPDAKVDVTVEPSAPKTTSVAEPVAKPPERSTVSVAVLNGTTTPGRAAQTAAQLKDRGYTTVATGNTGTVAGPTVVYFRQGAKPGADLLATDLQVTRVSPIEGTSIAADAEATKSQVVVVLGTG